MSPIDHELERALADRATGLVPPGDLLAGVEHAARGIRRRRGVLTGAAALSVLAIAVAVPLSTRDDAPRPGVGVTTQPPTPTPELAPTQAPVTSPSPEQPRGVLGWAPRGQEVPRDDPIYERIDATATREFAEPPHWSIEILWSAVLPDGRRLAVFESLTSPAYVHFYVEDADGSDGRFVQRLEVVDRNPQGPVEGKRSQTRLPQISAYVDGPQDFVVILGAPTTGQLEFSTDGRRYRSVQTFEGAEIIAVTKGEDRTAYRVRVYDGDGVVVYDGPIDLLPED